VCVACLKSVLRMNVDLLLKINLRCDRWKPLVSIMISKLQSACTCSMRCVCVTDAMVLQLCITLHVVSQCFENTP